ncbi:hypothetical protein PC129_g25192, partial [Phytophthora cactorum]
STWVPFGDNLERIWKTASVAAASSEFVEEHRGLDADHDPHTHNCAQTQTETTSTYDPFVRELLASGGGKHGDCPPGVPVLLGHGVDDAYVDVELGRQAARILSQAGHIVDRREYSGAEQEGHWFQVQDQMNHVYEFLRGFEGL